MGPGPTVSKYFTGPFEEFENEAAASAMGYLHLVAERFRSAGVAAVRERLEKGPAAVTNSMSPSRRRTSLLR